MIYWYAIIDWYRHTVTGKPNSVHDADGNEDLEFLEVMNRAQQTPVEKVNPYFSKFR